jgi:putative addiction module killer protein
MTEVRQTEVFTAWLVGLRDRQARARILARIRRLSEGNPGDVKPVGGGVSEMRIDYGPWLPAVFRRPWQDGGDPALRGDKRSQDRDIAQAIGMAQKV